MEYLRKLDDLTGYQLQAHDGEIGKVKHIYFDDERWVVRYFVVRTGSWLFGNEVLITPNVITGVDEENKHLNIDLNLEQIKNCPPLDSELPVSRHYELQYYKYYGWQPYWHGGPITGPGAQMPPINVEQDNTEPEHPHLRSSKEVSGYRIRATDGEIGHVEDFILEEPEWIVRYLEVDTRNWLPGKNVLVSPTWIQQVEWASKEVLINLKREAIETAPPYDSSKLIDRDYQVALFSHYGMKFEKR